MIDSLNLLVRDIKWIDFKYLKKFGIHYKKFKRIRKNGYVCTCYSFKYKRIKFIYNKNDKTVLIRTNTHVVLNKKDITISDRIEYELKIQKILQVIFNTQNVKYEVNRIDYCDDIKTDEMITYIEGLNIKKFTPTENDMKIYHYLLWYGRHSYKYMKQYKVYGTSIYLQTKHGQRNFQFYDRYSKTKKEEDKGIYRVELQLKSKFLKSNLKKEGTSKDLDNYWSEDGMIRYYFVFLQDYYNKGDYYKLDEGTKIIKKSKNNTVKMRNKLIKFRENIITYTLDNLLKPKFCKEVNKLNKKKVLNYSYTKIKNYTERLDEIGVNPISIIDYNGGKTDRTSLPNLLKLLRSIAEEKYFK